MEHSACEANSQEILRL